MVIGLRNSVLLVCNVIIFGLLYDPCSWVSMLMIVIVEFHPVRVRLFDTLNWAETLALSMRKHALKMFLYDKK